MSSSSTLLPSLLFKASGKLEQAPQKLPSHPRSRYAVALRDFDTKTGQLLVTVDPSTFAQKQCLQTDPTKARGNFSWRHQVFPQK